MIYKDCPRCHEISKSMKNPNKWLCPYCGTDISDVSPMDITEEEYSSMTSKGVDRDIDPECAGGSCPVR